VPSIILVFLILSTVELLFSVSRFQKLKICPEPVSVERSSGSPLPSIINTPYPFLLFPPSTTSLSMRPRVVRRFSLCENAFNRPPVFPNCGTPLPSSQLDHAFSCFDKPISKLPDHFARLPPEVSSRLVSFTEFSLKKADTISFPPLPARRFDRDLPSPPFTLSNVFDTFSYDPPQFYILLSFILARIRASQANASSPSSSFFFF